MMLFWSTPCDTFVWTYIQNNTIGQFNCSQLAKILKKEKKKSRFLTSPYHKIYRVEDVGLKSSNYTLQITIFVNMWNLGQFRENLIFCQ